MKLTGPESIQGTPEWLAFRNSNKIGASDMVNIMLSKWSTPYELWCRKLGFAQPQASNPAMSRGNALEPLIRDMVNDGRVTPFKPCVFVHPDYEWAMASLDGWDEETSMVLEIKTANATDHKLVTEEGVPPAHYKPQLHWQLFCTGAKDLIYASYHKDDLKIAYVRRDDDYINNKLLPAATDFYRCLVDLKEPELLPQDYRIIGGRKVQENALDWQFEDQTAKYHAKRAKELREMLVPYAEDGNCKGCGIRMRHVEGRTTINYSGAWEEALTLYPDLAEKIPLDKYTTKGKGSIVLESDKSA